MSAKNIVLLLLAQLSFACESGGVGDPCVPEDEYDVNFSGFSETEVNIERRSFQCETRVCLVNHFRGRVTCPYGQDGANGEVTEGAQQAGRCTVPGGDANGDGVPDKAEDEVLAPVEPQLKNRPADVSVYCSCRCNGPDKNANYCECPSGFTCEELVPDIGFGGNQLVGSYCVRAGTQADDSSASKQKCDYATRDEKDTSGENRQSCGPTVNLD